MEQAGLTPRFVQGRRYTDEATLEIVARVLAEEINADIVRHINKFGGRASGLHHKTTLQCLYGRRLTLPDGHGGSIDLGLVGEVTEVETPPIENHAWPASCRSSRRWPRTRRTRASLLNVNADTAAAAVAQALQAEKLVFLTDTPGILMNKDEPDSLIPGLTPEDCRDLIEQRRDRPGDDPQGRGLPHQPRGRGPEDPHHRRPAAARPPPRDLHAQRASAPRSPGARRPQPPPPTAAAPCWRTLRPERIRIASRFRMDRSRQSDRPSRPHPSRFADTLRGQQGDTSVDPARRPAPPRRRSPSSIATSIANYKRFPVCLVRGEGSWIWDAEGNRYLDFFPGWGCNLLGHCPPRVVEAVQRPGRPADPRPQHLVHGAPGRAGRGPLDGARSAASASSATAGPRPTRPPSSWPGSSATTAAGIKIVTMEGGFHGRTYAALTATAQPKYHAGFEPMVPGFEYVPYDDLGAVAEVLDDKTAAILVEPIQGEGGINIPSPDYLAGSAAALRPPRRAPDPRRGPDRHGPHRQVVRLPARGRRSPTSSPAPRPWPAAWRWA